MSLLWCACPVSCSDTEDFSLECAASDLAIKNISFEQEGSEVQGIILVKSGQLTLEECDLKCSTNGVTVESNAEFIMNECKVHGAKVSSNVFHSNTNSLGFHVF